MIELLIWVSFLFITLIYTVLIGFFSAGWFRLQEWRPGRDRPDTKASVIVAVRNEKENIGSLLQDLMRQDIPTKLYEIIIVDDASGDGTQDEMRLFRKEFPGVDKNLIYIMNEGSGKKAAIETGIRIAGGELIVTTDGDCRVGRSWLKSLLSYYRAHKPVMISGPVKISPYNNILEAFQSLEIQSLVATGAGAVRMGRPIMCNGANLAYTKAAFAEVGGYEGDKAYASGDDIFLLHKIHRRYGSGSVHFIKSPGAMVTTSPERSPVAFLNQRFRWVSKSRGYTSFAIIFTAFTVLLFNACILTAGIMSFSVPSRIALFLTLFGVKLMADFPVLYSITKLYDQKKLMYAYPLFQVIYIPYTVFTGFLGNMLQFSWKGRKLKK